jgi:predicted nucleotidyltransferase component of viral defense system
MSSEDFNAQVERAMLVGNRAHMRPVIEKELLHHDILFALDAEGLLDSLTFQGGTSLRLCYGSARLSEDLDFVGGVNFNTQQFLSVKSCIERYIGDRYGLEVRVKEPKEMAQEPEHRHVLVHKWQIRVTTAPARRDLPKQIIKIEIAAVPAHERVPQQLRQNYDFLPDGYGDLVILTESLDEIMADKLVSLVNCTAYVRHRDIWDLHWLAQQGAKRNDVLLGHKLADYSVTDYETKAAQLSKRLPEIVRGKAFRDQMARFIPLDVQQRTLLKDKFLAVLERDTVEAVKYAVASQVGRRSSRNP